MRLQIIFNFVYFSYETFYFIFSLNFPILMFSFISNIKATKHSLLVAFIIALANNLYIFFYELYIKKKREAKKINIKRSEVDIMIFLDVANKSLPICEIAFPVVQ